MPDLLPFLQPAVWEQLLRAPNAVARLRGSILGLAVRGQLVPQNDDDEPAQILVKRIAAQREQMVREKKIRKTETLPPIEENEKPFTLPTSWEWVRLGEICPYIQRGKSPSYVERSDFPIISQKCIQWSGIEMSHAKYIDPESLDNYGEERFLRTGDLLWNSTGTGTVGRIGIYDSQLIEYSKVVADSHVTVLRAVEIEPRFLYLWIASPTIQNKIDQMVSGTTKQVELNLSTAIRQPAPLPPLAEQKRIVAKVDELMALCDALETQLRQAQETGAALWQAIVAHDE